MLQYHTVHQQTLELLRQLQQHDLFRDLRLVGGTSLALQIGHRTSIDIDLFGSIDVDEIDISAALASMGSVTQLKSSKNIHIYLLNNVKVDIVNYPYPWLQPAILQDGLLLADLVDIAAMKIAAVTGRGSKKDFVDLYFLLKQMDIAQILDHYVAKYKDGSLFMTLKSIIYFDDADKDEMPNMFSDLSWNEVKETISAAYAHFMKK
jgi:predicted nucleotidyltransferase component of viral defense system